jgi:hypothetical protein
MAIGSILFLVTEFREQRTQGICVPVDVSDDVVVLVLGLHKLGMPWSIHS